MQADSLFYFKFKPIFLFMYFYLYLWTDDDLKESDFPFIPLQKKVMLEYFSKYDVVSFGERTITHVEKCWVCAKGQIGGIKSFTFLFQSQSNSVRFSSVEQNVMLDIKQC